MYKILGIDNKQYGPISAEILRQWIADRRANGQTQAQAEGSTGWRPLSEFPEFAEALAAAVSRPAAPSLPPSTPPPPNPSPLAVPLKIAKTSGMAITSLVLGILGLLTCGITALIGLVLGIVSLLRIRNSDGRISGQGIAIAGICVSVAFLFAAPIVAALFLPAVAKAKGRAQAIHCVNNLKQIGLGARLWAEDHNDAFPEQIIFLTNEISKPFVFICPSDPKPRTGGNEWSDFQARDITYEYLGSGLKATNPRTELARCPIHGHVLFADGSVQQGRMR